ncbi:hypothetical protein CON09_08310 [Bacillus anthracis]|nr:hypothetical protein CON09_08310 [Bacillus anthracis]
MKQQHKELLEELQAVINKMSLACEEDYSFNTLLCELNEQQNVFGCSIDEIDIDDFIEEQEEKQPSFEFMGMHIVNPYMDETGRFRVLDPCEYYGISEEFLKQFPKED